MVKGQGVKFGGLLLLFLFCSLLFLAPGAGAQDRLDLEAESAILIDVKTGTILYEKNSDQALPPASMSKMMVEYLVMEAIEEGKLSWDTPVAVSEYAHYIASLDGTSRVWLAQGEERTVKELYTAMAVYSANDATVALAEKVAGSEKQFVQMMNDKAAQLGMTNSRFVNSTGLPNSMLGSYVHTGSPQDENAMSARDTAILARALLAKYPDVLQFSSIPVVEPGDGEGRFPVRLINFNWMLPDHPYGNRYVYDGLDGLKTGYTELAQYCFTGTAERDGRRLVSVVMRTPSEEARFVETRKLLDYGFEQFGYHVFADKGDVIQGFETVPVSGGKELEVSVQLGDRLEAMVSLDETDLYTIEVELKPEVTDENGHLVAPLAEGEQIGVARLVYTGEESLGFLGESVAMEAPLLTAQEVEKAGFFRKVWRGISSVVSKLFNGVAETVTGWFS